MSELAFHVAGVGLLALDVVLTDDSSSSALTYAGGTCGNILSILSYLQWKSSAIGYIGCDDAGDRMLADLMSVGVQSAHLSRDISFSTPVFVQKLLRNEEGRPRHSFSQHCPKCGQQYGGGRSMPVSTPIHEFNESSAPDVFFMDRLSPDILTLATSAKSRGAFVFYEPSARSDMEYWAQALAVTDVVKYSAERFDSNDLELFLAARPSKQSLWEVQTLGAEGLNYRRHSSAHRASTEWIASAALVAPRVVDTCGAGDWCSAGLLYGLFSSPTDTEDEQFANALRLGQALAAWACAFVGARGAMYCSDSASTLRSARRLAKGDSIDLSRTPTTARSTIARPETVDACLTASCSDDTRSHRA